MATITTPGLKEAVPPRRLGRWVDRFTVKDLELIRSRLESKTHPWMESEELCESRSQAYYRAQALIEVLVHVGLDSWRFQRRTWPDGGGTRWAIRLRKE
jgi:hypothetical protein